MSKERARLEDCIAAGCQEYRKCQVKWGKDCNRQMGRKVPRIAGRYDDSRKPIERTRLVITGGPGEEIRVRRASGDPYYG